MRACHAAARAGRHQACRHRRRRRRLSVAAAAHDAAAVGAAVAALWRHGSDLQGAAWCLQQGTCTCEAPAPLPPSAGHLRLLSIAAAVAGRAARPAAAAAAASAAVAAAAHREHQCDNNCECGVKAIPTDTESSECADTIDLWDGAARYTAGCDPTQPGNAGRLFAGDYCEGGGIGGGSVLATCGASNTLDNCRIPTHPDYTYCDSTTGGCSDVYKVADCTCGNMIPPSSPPPAVPPPPSPPPP